MISQVAISSNPPGMFASLDALLAASTSHCSEMALVNTARMVVSLKADVLQQQPRLASLSASQSCAILLLYNSSLARLAMTLHCPQMLELAVAVPLTACPQLRSVGICFFSFFLFFPLSLHSVMHVSHVPVHRRLRCKGNSAGLPSLCSSAAASSYQAN